MQLNNFINRLNILQTFFEVVEVWLQDFVKHVVQVILAELKHLVSGPVSLMEERLDVALFR